MTLSPNGIDRRGFLASSARRTCTTLRKRYLDREIGLVDQLARDRTVSFKRFKAADDPTQSETQRMNKIRN